MAIRVVAAAVLAFALGALVWFTTRGVARELSGTWDETVYLAVAQGRAATHSGEQLAHLGVAPLPVILLWTNGVLAPLGAPPHDAAVYRARLDRARMRAAWWIGIPLVLLVFVTLARSRGIATGAVAATLLACSPNIAAHYSLPTTDAAFALAFAIVLIVLIAYLRTQTAALALTLSIALGIALSTKYSALGLYAAALVLFAMHWRTRRTIVDAAVLGGSLFAAWACHGFETAPLVVGDGAATRAIASLFGWTGEGNRIAAAVGGLPAPNFVRGIAAQAYLDRAGQEAFLLGRTAQHGWWYYFPVAIALKSTPVELIAFAAFGIFACVRRMRDIESRVVVIVFTIFAGAILASHRDLGVRYALPLIVAAMIGGVVWTGDALRHRGRVAVITASLALLAQAISYRSIAPDYLSYFNAASGGPSEGYRKLVDSNLDWGQDLTRLRTRLDAHGTDRVALAYFGSAPVAAYGVRAESVRSLGGPEPPSWLAVSATLLQGAFVCGDPFAPLRALRPDDRAGYSILMFDTGRPDVRAAMEPVLKDPCLP